MLDTKSIADDHYLHLTLSSDAVKADFRCINHEKCEPVKLIDEENAQYDAFDHDTALEWYNGKETVVLESGNVNLITEGDFIGWHYLDKEQTPNELFDTFQQNAHEFKNALIAEVGQGGHVEVYLKCFDTHNHESDTETCYVDSFYLDGSMNVTSSYIGEEGTEFKNDFIKIQWHGKNNMLSEDEWGWEWFYATDAA
jgi:hypothetical protein